MGAKQSAKFVLGDADKQLAVLIGQKMAETVFNQPGRAQRRAFDHVNLMQGELAAVGETAALSAIWALRQGGKVTLPVELVDSGSKVSA